MEVLWFSIKHHLVLTTFSEITVDTITISKSWVMIKITEYTFNLYIFHDDNISKSFLPSKKWKKGAYLEISCNFEWKYLVILSFINLIWNRTILDVHVLWKGLVHTRDYRISLQYWIAYATRHPDPRTITFTKHTTQDAHQTWGLLIL